MARTERGIITRWASLVLLAAIAVVAAFSATATPAWANTFTVRNTDDQGAGSLRQAITDANNTPGEDTITFAPGVESTSFDGTLGLKSALPQLSSVRIEGPGSHRLTVRPYRESSGGVDFTGQFRIFTVGAGATVSIDGLTISGGGAPGGDGGAILNPATGTLKVTDSTISHNGAGNGVGGGIYNEGALTVESSTVCNNAARSGGGGIYNAASGTLTVAESTVCDNTDPLAGGGVYNEGTLTVEGSTFSRNRAFSTSQTSTLCRGDACGRGGAIFNPGTLTMSNATVSENSAPQDGAGIHNDGTADIKSTTITANAGGIGGGVLNGKVLILTNSIVARNNTSGDIHGDFTDGGFNLVGDTIMFDPMLGPLQDNGGPTKTHLPLAGSPAIDQGHSKDKASTDQRGVERPQDDPLVANPPQLDGSDIGAVELKVPQASINDVTVTEGTGGTTSATFTVGLSESEVSSRIIRANYATRNDEATAPADYASASGTLDFNSRGWALSKTVTVAIQGDSADEPTEGFFVELSGRDPEYVADGSGLGIIRDDDGPPALSIGDATATEASSGTANAVFTVSLSSPSGKAVSVDYSTSDGTATAASGDYAETSGTLYLRPGTTSKSVSVPVNSDTSSEPDETFFLNLSGPENATVADDKGEGTIVDSTPPSNGAPTASSDSYSTGQDKPLRVTAPGLLLNDSDPEGATLTASGVTDPTHGEVFVRANGSFAYFPDDGYLGADSFTYKASDGSNSSETATVSITVRDVTAPTVSATSPASGATGVSPRANVTATFSEAMKASSIITNTFRLYKTGSTTAITATVTYDAATKRATLDPGANLRRGATYRAVVSAGARDLAGNTLDQNPSVTGNQQKVWSFTIKP
jgi:hypothetical protein